MTKIMIFIDGTWLYATTQAVLSRKFGEGLRLDYGALPEVLSELVAAQLGQREVDVVRTHFFGSYPRNYDAMDVHLVDKRLDFYDMLRTEYHYEVELFGINYKGRRVRREDRQPGDEFTPQEKCVDIALSASALFNAAIPDAYDIAVCVVGDRDFIPMLQLVRRLGKRVAIASIKGSCAAEYADPADRSRVRDYDLIWIDDHVDRLELKVRRRQVECQSPHHEGDRIVETDELVRKGRPYYCKSCREKYKREHAEVVPVPSFGEPQESFGGTSAETAAPEPGEILDGKVKFVNDKGWGFIERSEGDYFFHVSDLTDEDAWPSLESGTPVQFQVVRRPDPGNRERPSGQATRVAQAGE